MLLVKTFHCPNEHVTHSTVFFVAGYSSFVNMTSIRCSMQSIHLMEGKKFKKKYGRNWVTSYVQASVQTNLLRKLHKAPENTGIYKFFGIKMSSDTISEHLNFSGRLSGHALRPLCKQSCDPLSQVTFTTYAHSNTIKWTTSQYCTVQQIGREWG